MTAESYGDYWYRMRERKERGFTLFELMITLVVAGILAILGSSIYTGYIERARIAHAVGDVMAIYITVDSFTLSHGRYPTSLDEIGFGEDDPWGNSYVFAPITSNGEARKNRNMVPVNRRYDVYSMGPDGKTASPFTSTTGSDDIVMAGDGTYFGAAADFGS